MNSEASLESSGDHPEIIPRPFLSSTVDYCLSLSAITFYYCKLLLKDSPNNPGKILENSWKIRASLLEDSHEAHERLTKDSCVRFQTKNSYQEKHLSRKENPL